MEAAKRWTDSSRGNEKIRGHCQPDHHALLTSMGLAIVSQMLMKRVVIIDNASSHMLVVLDAQKRKDVPHVYRRRTAPPTG